MKDTHIITTHDCLLAHFAGNPILAIEVVANYLHIDCETLVNKINQGKVALTYFRLTDGQKGKKFVKTAGLAAYIDTCHAHAQQEFSKLR